MRPREKVESGQTDMFRPRLDQIIDMKHPLVRLRQEMDWPYMREVYGAVYKDGPGQPPLPTELMVGLAIIKHTDNLSDEDLTERWVRDPYYQYLCGEEFFQHKAPFDRSSLTRWRQRMGEERLVALLQETLRIAHKTGAIATQDLQRVAIDTTVQPKNIAHPTDYRLLWKAIEKLTKLAKKEGLQLRQSYARVAKRACIMAGRYIHAKQFNRAKRAVKFLRVRLGRVLRDIRRQLDERPWLEDRFQRLMMLASQVRYQEQYQRGPKVYALHAPEVECIGKGKARAPYEFGCKVSLVAPVTKPKGGQFVLHAEAHHGNPYDGHTLGPVLARLEERLGIALERGHVDKGYRGHNYENKFKIWITDQKRRLSPSIKREMKRRAAIEPVIGHVKSEHRMGRNYLKHRQGDRINPVLAAAGFNFHLLLRWFAELLLRLFLAQLIFA
jgi:transposase, IS5 family